MTTLFFNHALAQQEPVKQYLGRVIAPTMTFHGASWLIRPDRNKEENTDLVMRQLQLKEGMTACDLGCGNGYYTLRMAERVGATGKILAVDIQPEMLTMLRQRADDAGYENVVPILGAFDNPNLPDGAVDLLIMADVYHEFSHPESMLKAIHKSLSKDGQIALLEYRMEDPTVPIKRLHKMSKTQIMREYSANNFKLVREFNGLPWQHLMFFARDDSSLPEVKPERWTKALSDDE
ncbi:MAG: class I SAM-dependent methyltransferase [Pirellulaceae bacterium]